MSIIATSLAHDKTLYDKRIEQNWVDNAEFLTRLDFWNKKHILGGVGVEVTPSAYYRLLYGDDVDTLKLFCFSDSVRMARERSGGSYQARILPMTVDDMEYYAENRKDLYYYPCSFRTNKAQRTSHEKQYAITLDLDNVDTAELQLLVKAKWFGLKPSVVVNSGHGLHLVYIFSKPYTPAWETRRSQRNALQRLVEAIANVIMSKLLANGFCCYIDRNSRPFVHAFRCVGSLTKAGDRVTAYRLGGLYDIDELFLRFGITTRADDDTPPPSREKRKRGTSLTETSARLCVGKLAHKKWYTATVNKLLNGGFIEGNREKSLHALSVIALKCGIGYDTVKADSEHIVKSYPYPSSPFTDKDIQKAIGWYDRASYRTEESYIEKVAPKFFIPSRSIEEWLAWEFQKRNHVDQHTHLARARGRKKVNARKMANTIQVYKARHPEATYKEIADRFHVSIRSAKKYLRGKVDDKNRGKK